MEHLRWEGVVLTADMALTVVTNSFICKEGACVEVRKQVIGVGSPFLPSERQRLNTSVQAW